MLVDVLVEDVLVEDVVVVGMVVFVVVVASDPSSVLEVEVVVVVAVQPTHDSSILGTPTAAFSTSSASVALTAPDWSTSQTQSSQSVSIPTAACRTSKASVAVTESSPLGSPQSSTSCVAEATGKESAIASAMTSKEPIIGRRRRVMELSPGAAVVRLRKTGGICYIPT